MPPRQARETPLRVVDEGPRDADVVVLLHGVTCSLEWYDALAALLRTDLRVVRPDLLGHGGSPRSAAYDERTQAAAVAGTLDALGVRRVAAVAGHSYGADVAVALALTDARVERVAVLAQAADMSRVAGLPTGVVRAAGHAVGLLPSLPGRGTGPATARGAFAPGFAHRGAFADPRRLTTDTAATDPAVLRHVMTARLDALAADGLDGRLARTGLPALVVLGDRDGLYPLARTRPRYDALPDVPVVVAHGSGHSVAVERPDVVATHLRELLARPA